MRLIDADALIDRIKNPYEQAQVARWVNEQPTIEPEKRTEERTETHACDLINRQQAIDAFEPTHYKDWYTPTIIETLETLPSVRPEVLACGNGELVKESGGLVKDLVKDCISRSQALNAINVGGDLEEAWINVAKLPSAQQEIIRCKDCKYWTYIKRANRYWCKTDDGLFDLNPSPDDFCSRAERRTDE